MEKIKGWFNRTFTKSTMTGISIVGLWLAMFGGLTAAGVAALFLFPPAAALLFPVAAVVGTTAATVLAVGGVIAAAAIASDIVTIIGVSIMGLFNRTSKTQAPTEEPSIAPEGKPEAAPSSEKQPKAPAERKPEAAPSTKKQPETDAQKQLRRIFGIRNPERYQFVGTKNRPLPRELRQKRLPLVHRDLYTRHRLFNKYAKIPPEQVGHNPETKEKAAKNSPGIK